MSENKEPKLKAGEAIVSMCPICKSIFNDPVETNVNHTCPNPTCGVKFCVMVFD